MHRKYRSENRYSGENRHRERGHPWAFCTAAPQSIFRRAHFATNRANDAATPLRPRSKCTRLEEISGSGADARVDDMRAGRGPVSVAVQANASAVWPVQGGRPAGAEHAGHPHHCPCLGPFQRPRRLELSGGSALMAWEISILQAKGCEAAMQPGRSNEQIESQRVYGYQWHRTNG